MVRVGADYFVHARKQDLAHALAVQPAPALLSGFCVERPGAGGNLELTQKVSVVSQGNAEFGAPNRDGAELA